MHFGPIFRAMTRNRARFVLIVAEVALTLAIVANCVSLIRHSQAELARESGFDDDNLLYVHSRPFAAAFREDAYMNASVAADVRALRAVPGVRAASHTEFLPWQGGGSSTDVTLPGSEARHRTQIYPVDPEIFDTLGVNLVRGRNFTREEYERNDPQASQTNIIVSQALADLIFPGGALGKSVVQAGDTARYTIVGIFDRFYNPYGWPIGEYAIFIPGLSGGYVSGASYLVRAQPGQAGAIQPEIEQVLLRLNNGRNVEIRPIPEVRESYDLRDQTVVAALDGVMILLVFVTALGIVGITAFSVAERQRQIGTRRALGATQGAILRHFLLENWMITTFGAVLGLALAYGLNAGLMTLIDGAKIDVWILAAGVALLWAVGLGASLGPALRAARIPPAIATRNV